MFLSCRNQAADERGTAMVELALVLPLMLLVLIGLMEFGRAFNSWNDANQMAATTARFAVVNRNPGAAAGKTLQQWTISQGDIAEIRRNARVCISFPESNSSAVGKPVKVTVREPFTFRKLPRFLTSVLSLGTVTLTGSATMRLEAPPGPPVGSPAGTPPVYSTAANSAGCP